MAFPIRPKLTIPAVLAVYTLAAGCPQGDDAETGNETGPSTTTAATDSSTGADTGATSGVVPSCEGMDEAMCTANGSCEWHGADIGCIINCGVLEDEATCMSIQYCEWFEDACYGTI